MSLEINQFNLNSGILNKYKNYIYHNTYWHKIMVENVKGLDREEVLKTVMKFCHPLHFIPVSYESLNNKAHFLMKNCGEAIERMCNHNLIIANSFNIDKPFKISIKLCFANANDLKINIGDNVLKVLKKRFSSETGVLNLENFAKDSDLKEYSPLSQPKLLFYILHLAKGIHFKTLKLCFNDIESLKPMEALAGSKALTAIDLRNNNITSSLEISYLRDLKIKELWLDGNPICDNYDEFTYGRAVTEHLEQIEKLDGVNIQSKVFLPFRQNFLCSQTGYDLVDQFLEHYFTLYDKQRYLLTMMYNDQALFSLSSNYLPSQTTSSNARLSVYKIFSRNLLHISDSTKPTEFLFLGPRKILKILKSLPATEHDPFSFTVDLIMYTNKAAILVVSGVFREISESVSETARLLNFTRTFVLLAGRNGEYSIINEIMNISNATTTQAVRAFKYIKLPDPHHIYIPQPQDTNETDTMVETFTTITGMNLNWSKKCLEQCNYNLSEALPLFVELFKTDKIPGYAFDSLTGDPNGDQKQEGGKRPDIKKILNQTHEYGGADSAKAAHIMPSGMRSMPSIAPLQATTPTTTNFQPTNIFTGHIQSFNPPNPVIPVRPVIGLNQANLMMPMNVHRPPVPPMRNIIHPALNSSGPMLGNVQGIMLPRPIIRPNISVPPKQKNVSRESLVNIDLKK